MKHCDCEPPCTANRAWCARCCKPEALPAPTDATLAMIDALRSRGATHVEVNGVKAVFATTAVAPPAERASRRKEKSYHERLFGPLGINKDAPKPEETRAQRLKRNQA